jgi:hypothetical protein
VLDKPSGPSPGVRNGSLAHPSPSCVAEGPLTPFRRNAPRLLRRPDRPSRARNVFRALVRMAWTPHRGGWASRSEVAREAVQIVFDVRVTVAGYGLAV